MALSTSHRQLRSPLWKRPPNYRGIRTFRRTALFLWSTLGYSVVPFKMVLHLGACWSTIFNLPLPVSFVFYSESCRTTVVWHFGCVHVFVLFSRCHFRLSPWRRPPNCRGIVRSGIWASVVHSTTAGSACLFVQRPPNCRGIVPPGLFANTSST